MEPNLIAEPIIETLEPIPSHVFLIRNRRRVSGVTSVGDEVVVVCYDSKYVDIYSDRSMPFHRMRTIAVPGLGSWPLGIASWAAERLVFVSDYTNNALHRVELVSRSTMRWSVASSPTGLSMTSSGNVIVVCNSDNIIQEYSVRGFLIRQVDLRDELTGPWHAVLLADGRYAVSQQRGNARRRHRVCLVASSTGNVERAFNGSDASAGIAERRFNFPSGMAVARNGSILVADRNNARIVRINPTTGLVGELIESGTVGVKEPHAIHLDSSRNRLYVADYTENRIAVFDV